MRADGYLPGRESPRTPWPAPSPLLTAQLPQMPPGNPRQGGDRQVKAGGRTRRQVYR